MASFIFNIARGRIGEWALLPKTNDAFIYILFNNPVEADDTLNEYETLADLKANLSNVEASFSGYSRVTHSSGLTITIDPSGNTKTIDDTVDPGWTPTGSGVLLAKMVVCYDPDTTGGTDADLIPAWADDFVWTPASGVSFVYPIAVGGFYIGGS